MTKKTQRVAEKTRKSAPFASPSNSTKKLQQNEWNKQIIIIGLRFFIFEHLSKCQKNRHTILKQQQLKKLKKVTKQIKIKNKECKRAKKIVSALFLKTVPRNSLKHLNFVVYLVRLISIRNSFSPIPWQIKCKAHQKPPTRYFSPAAYLHPNCEVLRQKQKNFKTAKKLVWKTEYYYI